MKIRIAIKVVAEQKKLRHNAVVFKIYVLTCVLCMNYCTVFNQCLEKFIRKIATKKLEIKLEIFETYI